MKIAIGSDHAGFFLKNTLHHHLIQLGHEVVDLGTYSKERTDYPVYGEKVARAVAAGEFERGILICGTGIGMSITANKVHGIRAVVCSEPYSAILSRNHNDTNILAMGARVVGEGLAIMIAEQWLAAGFEGGRHQERVEMIAHIDDLERPG